MINPNVNEQKMHKKKTRDNAVIFSSISHSGEHV